MVVLGRNRQTVLDAARRCIYLDPLFIVTIVALLHGATWIYFRFMLGTYHYSAIDPSRVIFNLRLVQLLYVAVAVWLVLRSRRLITSNSGHGIVLASFGLHARLLSEFARDGIEFIRDPLLDSIHPPDVPAIFYFLAGTAYESQVALVGGLGITAFTVGLIVMAGGVISELRADAG